jgi:hypothetical protein
VTDATVSAAAGGTRQGSWQEDKKEGEEGRKLE